jgi:hypothetical protein
MGGWRVPLPTRTRWRANADVFHEILRYMTADLRQVLGGQVDEGAVTD